ncbi:hypothetical protein K2173_006230 [Erythroxylum novogranatense]|uniref:Uncharacterized protein n=1 Tax=Erythroxylum novogranatense TaxID=1862640 RepID=A0AAV8TEP6_9ROSI|nr:hypothetical protein K2173_006230 [Erythroxylum novogranatense]
METNLLQFRPPQSPPSTITVSTNFSSSTRVFQCPTFFSRRGRPFWLSCINSSGNDDRPQRVPPSITPPETVNIRFRRGSRKRRRQLKEDGDGGRTAKVQASSIPKKWEEMNMSEKAMEVYMGEKGLLFWLNKFAYASIFIVIGGWIVFRFVGPALNLYQLDTPPLSPSSMFKGS